MNENIDLCEILKDCPKGTKLWSKAHGVVSFQKIDLSADFPIYVKCAYGIISLSSKGQHFVEGECILIPSKEQRDWNKFEAPWYKKGKFDPNTLQPFDKILVRSVKTAKWKCEHFSYFEGYDAPCMASISYAYCVPYNDETKHLVGTTDEAPEFYRYWDD